LTLINGVLKIYLKNIILTGIIHLGRIGSNENSREGRYNANVIGSQRLLDLALANTMSNKRSFYPLILFMAHIHSTLLI
jgi:hypothetical protein